MTPDDYKLMAIYAIRRYLESNDTDTDIETKYELAVKRLVIKATEMDTVRINGIKTYTTDKQSWAFNEQDPFAITPDIQVLLPKKKRFYAW